MSVESSPLSSFSPSTPSSSTSSPSSTAKEQSNVQQRHSPISSSDDLIEISETNDPDDLVIQRKIQNKNLRNLMNQAKMAPQEQNGPYKCAFCKETFRTKTKSIEHLRSAHPERLPYYCKAKACSYVSKEALSVRLHIEHKHGIAYHESRDHVGNRFGPINWPKCIQCGRILNGPEELATHAISHTKAGYRCKWEGCGEFYGCTSQGIKHVKEVHFTNNAQFENCKEMDFLELIGTKGTSLKKRGKSKSKRWKHIPKRSKLTSANGKPVKTESINHNAINPAPESKIKSPKHRQAIHKSWSSLSSSAKQSNGQQESTAEDWVEINDTNSDDLLVENSQNKDLNNTTTETIKAKKPQQTVFHGRYKCCFCVATFERSIKSSAHMRSEHPELMPYYCKKAYCEYITVLQQALRWHVERKHNIKRNEAEKYFGVHPNRLTRDSPCPQCNRKMNGFESLVKHLGAHNKNGYRCKFNRCGYFFSSPIQAEKHIKTDHLKKDSKYARCNAKDYFECVKPDSSHKTEAIKPLKTFKTKHSSPISNGGQPKSDKPKSDKPKANKSKANKPKPNKPKPNNRKPVSRVPPPKNKEPQLSFLENGSPMSLITLHLFRHKTKLKSYRTVPVAGILDCAPFELMADAFIAFENHRKLLDPDYEQQPLTPISAASSVAALSNDDDENDPTFKGRPARNRTKRHMKDNVLTAPRKRKQSKLTESEPTDALVNRDELRDDDEVDELMAVNNDELADSQIALIRPAKYQCCICINKTFNISQSMNAHYRSEHHQLLPFYCKHSNCTYASFQAFKCIAHIKNVHSIEVLDEQTKFLDTRETVNCACKHCGRKFDEIRELKGHIESHFTCSGYRCFWMSECGFFYRFSEDARTHVKVDHFKDDPTFAERNPMDFLMAIKRGTYLGTLHYHEEMGLKISSDLASNASESIQTIGTNPQTNTSATNATCVSADISQAMPPNQAILKCSHCTEEFSSTKAKNEHDLAMHPETVPFYCKWTGETPCSFVSFIPQMIKAHIQKEHKVEHNAAAAVYVGTRLTGNRPQLAQSNQEKSTATTSTYLSATSTSNSISPSTYSTNDTVSAHVVEYPTKSSQTQPHPQTNTIKHAEHTTNVTNVPANISQVMIPAVPSNRTIHKCDICTEEFPSILAKMTHNLSMHPDETYYCMCGYCPFTAPRPQMIKDHIKSEHPVEHNPTTTDYVPLLNPINKECVCCECGRELTNQHQLSLHLKSHSSASLGLLQGYCCIWGGCNFFYASIDEAIQHVKMDHLLGDPVQLAMFDSENFVAKFVPKISATASTASPVELIKPIHSPATATTASSVTKRTSIVAAINYGPNESSSIISPFVQLTLPNQVKSASNTSTTVSSNVYVDRPAESSRNLNPKTNKGTATTNSTNAFANTSQTTKPNPSTSKCGICNSNFSCVSSLAAHERKFHPETRPFYCKFDKCPYVSFKSAHVTDHILREHPVELVEVANYFGARFAARRSCPECRRTFESKYTLSCHLQSHTKKGYRCTLCGFFFSLLSESALSHVKKEHLEKEPARFAHRNPKDFFECTVPSSSTIARVLAIIAASTQTQAPAQTSTATAAPAPANQLLTTNRVPELTNSHSVKQVKEIIFSNGTTMSFPVEQQILLPPSSNRVDTETLKQTNSSTILASQFNNTNNNQQTTKPQQQILIANPTQRITEPTLFYITPGMVFMVKPTNSISNNTAQPIVNNSVHNDNNSSVNVPLVSTAPAPICSTQSTFDPDLEMYDKSDYIVETTEQAEDYADLVNSGLQSQPAIPVNEDHLSENNNIDDLNQSNTKDVQILGLGDVMDYEDGEVSVGCQASGEMEDVEMEEQNKELVGVLEVNEGTEMEKVEEEKNEESQSSTTNQNDQQTESVHENMDYEDDEVIEEELEKDDAEKEGNDNLDEVNESEEEDKIDEVEEMENIEASSTSTVLSAQQCVTSIQQQDSFCFECHKKVNASQAYQHCSLCPLTYHLECIESGNLFTKQQLAIERYEALEQKPQDDDSGDINKLLTLPGVCDECVLKIVGKHYNRSKDGFSEESGVFKKDVETTYHNIANLLINKAKNWKFRGWKKLFKSSEASKTIFKEMDLETIASKENKYESLDELLFDVKLIVHNRTISNHRCPYTVDCLAQLMGYAKTEAEHIRLCDSCNRLYYKEADLPEKIYQGDTTYGEVFQMGCQNPHTVVWVRIDGEWWPAKVFRKYTECSWEASLDWVQVVTFGPQKFHTVEPCKLYNYSRKVPEKGKLETQDQLDAVKEANYYHGTLDDKFLDCAIPEHVRPFEQGNLYINTIQDASQLPIADPNDATGKSIPWKCQSCGKRLTNHRLDLCTVSFCSTKCKKVFLGRSRK